MSVCSRHVSRFAAASRSYRLYFPVVINTVRSGACYVIYYTAVSIAVGAHYMRDYRGQVSRFAAASRCYWLYFPGCNNRR